MKIGLLVGSLRKDSFNKKIAELAKKVINEGNEAEIIDISYLPFYNQDDDGENPREEYIRIREELKKMTDISSLPRNTTDLSLQLLKTS